MMWNYLSWLYLVSLPAKSWDHLDPETDWLDDSKYFLNMGEGNG